MTFADRVCHVLNVDVVKTVPLSGGCIGDVRALDLSNGQRVVIKSGGSGLDLEGWMLTTLAERSALPVPAVLHAEDDLLVMSWIETRGGITPSAEDDAADHLAQLHEVSGPAFGLERDTLIGGLHQPNTANESWIDFFVDQRLLFMGNEALRAGRLPAATLKRLEALCSQISRWIDEPASPSLLHGDMWTGNVLCRDGKIAAFIDPAIYYGDPEIELAFSTLFGTFGDAFFHRYRDHRPIAPGFFEARRDLYNLYPLLVHVRLFGSSYVNSVERTLSQFGV